jgi:hypothetical protein
MWMAGGGVKGGMNYGMTDDYGYEAVLNKMHIHDWHATVHRTCMGLDHEAPHLPLRWPRLPPHRCLWHRGEGDHGVTPAPSHESLS